MDLYRTHISNLAAIEEADKYFRTYSGDFTIFPSNEVDFSLEDSLVRLGREGAAGVNFIIRLRLTCQNTKRLFKNDEVKPTSVFVCNRTVRGNFEVVREIHI